MPIRLTPHAGSPETTTRETAGFRMNDPECLVEAGLSCPVCLSSAISLDLHLADVYDPAAACACSGCRHERRVFLTPDQALRLALRPPHPDCRAR
jgi:hypothetical protein